jgi:hypothetical protein
MTLNDYLKLDESDIDAIADYFLVFLNELSEGPTTKSHIYSLRGVADKFASSIAASCYMTEEERKTFQTLIESLYNKYMRHGFDDSLLTKALSNLFLGSKNSKREHLISETYTKTMELINRSKRIRSNYDRLEINGLYKPENVNKTKIRELIQKTISLINSDEVLKDKTKKKLVDRLNIILRDLDQDNINWRDIIGRVQETIIVLGALGSLIGGFSTCTQARDTLAETTTIIQNTSINYSYNSINETFNIQQLGGQTNQIGYFQLFKDDEQTKEIDLSAPEIELPSTSLLIDSESKE